MQLFILKIILRILLRYPESDKNKHIKIIHTIFWGKKK